MSSICSIIFLNILLTPSFLTFKLGDASMTWKPLVSSQHVPDCMKLLKRSSYIKDLFIIEVYICL
jgi:hypothetical protein